MAAKFEIRSPKAGQFTWVVTSQGRTLATGESYSRKALAEKAIESLRKAAASATIDDQTLTPAKRTTKAAAKTTKAAKTTARATRTTKKATSPRKTAGTATKSASSAKKAASSRKRSSQAG